MLAGHSSVVRSAALCPNGARVVPRCLTPEQLDAAFLPPEPPRWCVTGPGNEAETDPALWEPKWPYHTPEWRDWLVARDRGEDPPLPE